MAVWVAINMCAAFRNRKALTERAVYHLFILSCTPSPCLGFLSCMVSRARHSLLTRVSQQGRRAAVVAAFHPTGYQCRMRLIHGWVCVPSYRQLKKDDVAYP